jgi:hypothetical protein
MALGSQNQDEHEVTPPAAENSTIAEEAGEAFAEKKEEAKDTLEDLFDRIMAPDLPERALNVGKVLQRQQQKALEKIFREHENRVIENSQSGRAELEKNLAEAEKEAQARIELIQNMITAAEKEGITSEDILQLQQSLSGIEHLLQDDGHLNQIIKKIAENKPLNETDYLKVIDLLDPEDFFLEGIDPKEYLNNDENIEATSGAIVFSLMDSGQRKALLEYMITSGKVDPSKKAQISQMLDAFFGTGHLSIIQGKELIDLAYQNNLLTQEEVDQFEQKFENGSYLEKRKLMEEKKEQLQAKFAVNPMLRYVGAPLLGSIMQIHAGLWLLTNFLTQHGDWKNFATSPWTLLAAAEGVAGYHIEGKKYDAPLGTGNISQLIHELGEDPSKEEVEALTSLQDIYTNYDHFGSYLELGGSATIMDLYNEKMDERDEDPEAYDEKNPPQLTAEEIIEHENNPDRKSLLEKAHRKYPKQLEENINAIPKIWETLGIESEAQFQEKLAFIRKAQKLKGKYEANQSLS